MFTEDDFEGIFVPNGTEETPERERAETPEQLCDILNDIDNELYDLAYSAAMYAGEYYLRRASEPDVSRRLAAEIVAYVKAVQPGRPAPDALAVAAAVAAAENELMDAEYEEEAAFWKLLEHENDLVAQHTGGRGVNCVYGTSMADYFDGHSYDGGGSVDEEIERLAESAGSFILRGSVFHTKRHPSPGWLDADLRAMVRQRRAA